MVWDVIIIGGGPGGMQAAIAAASEGLTALVLERDKIGGQIGQTPRLENSVFANGGLTGPAFAKMMREQAERMDVVIRTGNVNDIGRHKVNNNLLLGTSEGDHYQSHTVVLAMGNRWSDLDIPGMKEAISHGQVKVGPVDCLNTHVEGKAVAVFGGGPSAGQAIIELARRGADSVHVVLRSKLRMPQYLIDRIVALPNVELIENTKVHKLARVGGELAITLPSQTILVDMMFACNGLVPATDWLTDNEVGVTFDKGGRIIHQPNSLQTHAEGIYVVGDCRSGSTPRVGVAIGDGSMVVTEIWQRFAADPVCHNCSKILA